MKEQCEWLFMFLWQDTQQNSFRKEGFALALGEGTVHHGREVVVVLGPIRGGKTMRWYAYLFLDQ